MPPSLARARLAAAASLCCMAALFAAGPARAEVPPAGEFRFQSLTARGSGCRPGTYSYNVSPDSRAFTMLFSDYVVDSTTRSGRPARKSCDVDIDFLVPAGWQFAVYGVFIRGYAFVEAGAVAVAKSFTSIGMMAPQQIGRQRLVGPYDGNYEEFTQTPLNQVEWSRCGPERTRRLNLRTAITTRPQAFRFRDEQGDQDEPGLGVGLPKALISVDSIDGTMAVQQRYAVEWRRCGSDEAGPVAASCTINASPQKSFTESARGPNQQAAKAKAIAKVVAACAGGTLGRPHMLPCRPANAVCRFP